MFKMVRLRMRWLPICTLLSVQQLTSVCRKLLQQDKYKLFIEREDIFQLNISFKFDDLKHFTKSRKALSQKVLLYNLEFFVNIKQKGLTKFLSTSHISLLLTRYMFFVLMFFLTLQSKFKHHSPNHHQLLPIQKMEFC